MGPHYCFRRVQFDTPCNFVDIHRWANFRRTAGRLSVRSRPIESTKLSTWEYSVSRPEPRTFFQEFVERMAITNSFELKLPKFQKAGGDSGVERPFSRRTLHDGYTSSRAWYLPANFSKRIPLPTSAMRRTEFSAMSDSEQSLTRTAFGPPIESSSDC